MTYVGTTRINGEDYEIDASGVGTWSIKDAEGTLGSADTLEAAQRQARTALARRKVKVSVPFRTLDGGDGVATGIHASNRKVLARIGVTPTQFDYSSVVLDAETPDTDINRLSTISDEIKKLRVEERKLLDRYRIDIRQRVFDAIKKVTEAEAK